MPAPKGDGLAIRASRVGASEVGALMDAHPYVTPADIWARLVGAPRERRETAAMSAGNTLEPIIATMWAQGSGMGVRRAWRTYAHESSALCATPDYYVPGVVGLLEVKLSSDWEMWATLPPYVYWQAMAQLACTGRAVCYVACFIGSQLKTFTVVRDDGDVRRMLDAVDAFMRDHVATRTPPADASAELVLKVSPPEAGTISASEQMEWHAYRMSLERERMAQAEYRMKEAKEQLAHTLQAFNARTIVGRGWTFGMDARGALMLRGKPQGAQGEEK